MGNVGNVCSCNDSRERQAIVRFSTGGVNSKPVEVQKAERALLISNGPVAPKKNPEELLSPKTRNCCLVKS